MATSVNFFQPGTDAAADSNAILRQRELAKLLLQQGQQGPSGQMAGGQFVAPSALSYANQLAQALGGAFMSKSADEKEREMGMRLQQQRAGEAQAFMQAANGTPASSREVAGPAAEGQAAPTQTTAAVPGDMNKALAIALQSQNPMIQGMAPKMLERQMSDASFNSTFGGGASGAPPVSGVAPSDAGGGSSGTPSAAGNSFIGNGYGQIPRDMALALYRKDPAEFAKAALDARKPQALREGDLVGPGPNGGVVSMFNQPKLSPNMVVTGRDANGQVTGVGAAPGSVSGVTALTSATANAEQQAQAGNQTVTVDFGPGIGTKTLLRSQLNQMLSGQAAPGAPAPTAPAPSAPQVAPQPGMRGAFQGDPKVVQAQINQIQDPQERANAMQAFRSQQQGANPAFNPQAGNPSLSGTVPNLTPTGQPAQMPGITVQDDAQKAYSTARAKDYATQAATVQQAGRAASTTVGNLNQLEQLYQDPNVATGALAENVSGLKNVAASFGVDVKGLSSEQAAQSLTNQMALRLRSTGDGGGMPGAMSDSDRGFLKSMTPDLTRTPEGRAKIMSAARLVAQREMKVADLAAQYEQKNGQLDVGFDQQLAAFSAANPMFKGTPKASAPAAPTFQSLAAQELERRRKASGK